MALVVKNVRLIDGTGGAPREGAAIVIEGNRIGAVGPAEGVAIPADATVIDAGGRTALPGLMDLHAGIPKLSYAPGGIPRLSHAPQDQGNNERGVAASVLSGVTNGRRCLDVGVTTVRVDCCNHHGLFALKETFASGRIEGPRLVLPGRAICMTGGHAWGRGAREADGPDEVRKAAREELKAGADWIKLMASGGTGTPNERSEDAQMTVEEMRAAAEEAHKKGMYVFAHVHNARAARNCIEAGVDCIEHGLELDRDLARAMAEKGIFLVPTLGIRRRIIEAGSKGQVPDFMYRKALPLLERHAQSLRTAMEAGVKIATGTDSGSHWFPLGTSLLWEMELLNEAGMSPMETIISATRRAAECLRMSGDLGTLEPKKLADLLIVEGDPLASMSNIRSTWLVLKEGRVVFQKPQA